MVIPGIEKTCAAIWASTSPSVRTSSAMLASVRRRGPFTWGKDAAQAVYHAVVLDECCKMARDTEILSAHCGPAPQYLQDKHYLRKHGPNAYYGQGGEH